MGADPARRIQLQLIQMYGAVGLHLQPARDGVPARSFQRPTCSVDSTHLSEACSNPCTCCCSSPEVFELLPGFERPGPYGEAARNATCFRCYRAQTTCSWPVDGPQTVEVVRPDDTRPFEPTGVSVFASLLLTICSDHRLASLFNSPTLAGCRLQGEYWRPSGRDVTSRTGAVQPSPRQ